MSASSTAVPQIRRNVIRVTRPATPDAKVDDIRNKIRGAGDKSSQLVARLDEVTGEYKKQGVDIGGLVDEPGKASGDPGARREAVALAELIKCGHIPGATSVQDWKRIEGEKMLNNKTAQPVGQGDFETRTKPGTPHIRLDIKSVGDLTIKPVTGGTELLQFSNHLKEKGDKGLPRMKSNLQKDPNLFICVDTSMLGDEEHAAFIGVLNEQVGGDDDLRSRVIEVSAMYPEKLRSYEETPVIMAPPADDGGASLSSLFGDG